MQISDLYEKQIDRRINPAVVVSEMKDYFVSQEIEEYVFTEGITKNVYKFLNALANKTEGKTGVWISGYYGSGKSHFIKYLFYCLNKAYQAKALKKFTESVDELDPLDEPNRNQVSLLRKKLEQLSIDEIIFNIDAVADHGNEKDRLTRVLLHQLNGFRGFNTSNIALALYLEKPLEQAGKFGDFKRIIEERFSEKWTKNELRFTNRYLGRILDIAGELDPEIDKDSLRKSILERDQDYTIEFLIEELKEFVKEKPENYRLLFLIDEVSQYIGSNTSLLLNLQTIVEEIGTHIGEKVWIICTAQQDLSNLIENTDDKTEDFGKILGRFETMISLESQDAAHITKKRILEKKSDGAEVLNSFYKDHKGAIENQFVFDHDLYDNYEDREDFLLTYPFIPYQFRLISDVFQSFSNVGFVGEGVKNTERSILGITHFTAQKCKDKEVGFFVPFDLFFNDQLEKNLTHDAREILDRAYKIKEVQKDPFARRVVNALFMISNLGDSQSVNFPATLENLSLLLLEDVNTSKQQIQQQVQQVLDVLSDKNIIQVSEGKYRFLSEDAILVAKSIANQAVNIDDRLKYIFDDIITKVVKSTTQMGTVTFVNNSFRAAISVDEKEITSRGDFRIIFWIHDPTELEVLVHRFPTTDLVIGINDWFTKDKELRKKVNDYIRTQKFVELNFSNATGSRIDTLRNFREINEVLLEEIHLRFRDKFLQTSIITSNNLIEAKDLNGATPANRFDDMLLRHLEGVYRKHQLSNNRPTSNQGLLSNVKQTKAHKKLEPAEEEVNNKLEFEPEGVLVSDIVKQFERPPYGWKDIATLDVLLSLAQKGYRRFEWRNEEVDLTTFANKALNSREREALSIHKEKVHSKEEVKSFVNAVNEIFNETVIPSETGDLKIAVDFLKQKLENKLTKLNFEKEEYEAYSFVSHIRIYYQSLTAIYNSRNNEDILKKVQEDRESLIKQRDLHKQAEEFIENNFTSYAGIKDFIEVNKNNFDSLDEEYQEKAESLRTYLNAHTEPWEDFPQMKRAHKELNTALSDRLNHLRKKVMDVYETIYAQLQEKERELEITEPNIYPDRDHTLGRIQREKSISQLEIYELKADSFRAEGIKSLEDFKAKQKAKASGKSYQASLSVSLAAEMPPTTIETPEQLEAYLEKLREKLMVKLGKNQKLFLN